MRFYNLFLYLVVFSITLSGSSSDNINLKKVSLQLQWKHQFEFAGYYIAKQKGFYKDAGLDVQIKEFSSNIDIASDIEQCITTFGTAYQSIVLDRAKGRDIVLLNAMLQSSPHVLVSLRSSGIKSIRDFNNKRIMASDDELNTASFRGMLFVNNIKFEDMYKLKRPFEVQKLIDDRTDIFSSFLSNTIHKLDKLDVQYDIWNPKEYGFDFCDNILFTSAKMVKQNPMIVEKFQKASLKGWEYAYSNIDEAVELILQKYNTQNKTKEDLIYEANILKKLAYSDTNQLGKIEKSKIQRIYDVYNLMGMTNEKIDYDQFIYRLSKKDSDKNIPDFDYSLFWNIFGVILVLVLALAYRQYILDRANMNLKKIVKEKTDALQQINNDLESKINEAVAKNREKDKILYEQSKMAAMGEMIGNIAHQWRQPLAVIAASATGMKIKKEFGKIDQEEEVRMLNSISQAVQYLSKTIDDFRDFLKPNNNEIFFSIKNVYHKTLSLLTPKFNNKDIEVIENIVDIELFGLENELMQVLMNILNNANDILETRQNQRRLIFVNIYIQNGNAVLKIQDNGGGIPNDIITKIFEPYFTTKHKSQGTGIGLYMSQEIVVKHMQGTINVKNVNYRHEGENYSGAQFIITIPLGKDIRLDP